MRIITISKILIMLLFVANFFCAFFHKTGEQQTNYRKEITRGVTTENMVVNLLGMPTSVNPNSIGDEVWNYQNLSYSPKISEDNNTLILWELTTGDSTEVAKPFTLLITIDQNDIVKNFELVFALIDRGTK